MRISVHDAPELMFTLSKNMQLIDGNFLTLIDRQQMYSSIYAEKLNLQDLLIIRFLTRFSLQAIKTRVIGFY